MCTQRIDGTGGQRIELRPRDMLDMRWHGEQRIHVSTLDGMADRSRAGHIERRGVARLRG
jgi:hypothetical protein